MPNGNPKFHEEELPLLESFFSKIAGVLNEFASTYNLKLEKYWHQIPSWRFNFRHPKGGVGSVDVEKVSDNSIKIYKYWWIDDYDKFTRYVKTDTPDEIKIGDVNHALLKNQLNEVINWKLGDWTEIATGYKKFWEPLGKDWLENDVEKYPEVKVNAQ